MDQTGTPMEKRTYSDWYEWGVARLTQADIPEAKLDARLLLEASCNTDYNTLLAHGERMLSPEEQRSYVNFLKKREKRIPLQYLTGKQEFMGLDFLVNESVLIPRQDTEVLVEEVMRHFHDGMRILDLCTGSGCILLSLLHYSNDCEGIGVDISEAALQVAQENAVRILEKRESAGSGEISAGKVKFVQGDLYDGLKKGSLEDIKFDIIVSNPPYIKRDEILSLMPEVKEYEPVIALDGGEDGLIFYRRIIEGASGYLNGGGMLFFEIGADQGMAVSEMLLKAGYHEVELIKDLAGLDRVVYGEKNF